MMTDPGRAPPPSPIHRREPEDGMMSDEAIKQAFSAELYAKLRKFELDEKKQEQPIKSISSAIGAYRRGLQMEHEVIRMRAKERHERALKRRRLNDVPNKVVVPKSAPNTGPVTGNTNNKNNNNSNNDNVVKSR